jgi:alkanesulfonate monooxygenase SsuD/methylene tetrahydromethanopterin reductase-like flavin-dependent oxidoreductase (luciferase family)
MTAPTMKPAPEASYPTVVAANGPKMIELAAELADGVPPAGLPPAFTARLREELGPDKLVVVGMSVIAGTADLMTGVAQLEQLAPAVLGNR